jgi:hypothetical protein
MRKGACYFLVLLGVALFIVGIVVFVLQIRNHTTFIYALFEGGGVCFIGFIIGLIGVSQLRQTSQK